MGLIEELNKIGEEIILSDELCTKLCALLDEDIEHIMHTADTQVYAIRKRQSELKEEFAKRRESLSRIIGAERKEETPDA